MSTRRERAGEPDNGGIEHDASAWEAGSTRSDFLKQVAAGGAGLALAGGGAAAARRLFAVDEAAAALGLSDTLVRRFHSRPDLRPPGLTVLQRKGAIGDGHLFLSPSSGPGQRGVLILDETGAVVWFRPTTPNTAMNFRAGVYRGAPVLTWWEGKAERGLGRGHHVIVDASYKEIARFPAGDGRQSDLHEFVLTPRGTALVTSYEVRTMDLSAAGGRGQGKVIGGLVQEIEIPSARVVFQWRSLDHVGIDESHAELRAPVPYDYFHINSIDVDADGHFLVSARNTWGVYKIHRKTGKVIWRLGGKKSDFAMGDGTFFAWQHDARHHAEGRLISIFDDGAEPAVEEASRALVIELDRKNRQARLVRAYAHRPERVLSRFMGNAQILPNGNLVVGWGSEPYVTEFGPDGSVRFDAKLPRGGQNYRAFRFPWVGRPSEAPTAVAKRSSGERPIVYASWNGATEVAAWRLDVGTAPDALQPAATRPRRGFETALPVPTGARYASAVALGAKGKPLGQSKTIRV